MFDDTQKVFSRSEELESMGLRVPEITKITTKLREMGVPLSEGILTVEDAFREIRAILKKEGKL